MELPTKDPNPFRKVTAVNHSNDVRPSKSTEEISLEKVRNITSILEDINHSLTNMEISIEQDNIRQQTQQNLNQVQRSELLIIESNSKTSTAQQLNLQTHDTIEESDVGPVTSQNGSGLPNYSISANLNESEQSQEGIHNEDSKLSENSSTKRSPSQYIKSDTKDYLNQISPTDDNIIMNQQNAESNKQLVQIKQPQAVNTQSAVYEYSESLTDLNENMDLSLINKSSITSIASQYEPITESLTDAIQSFQGKKQSLITFKTAEVEATSPIDSTKKEDLKLVHRSIPKSSMSSAISGLSGPKVKDRFTKLSNLSPKNNQVHTRPPLLPASSPALNRDRKRDSNNDFGIQVVKFDREQSVQLQSNNFNLDKNNDLDQDFNGDIVVENQNQIQNQDAVTSAQEIYCSPEDFNIDGNSAMNDITNSNDLNYNIDNVDNDIKSNNDTNNQKNDSKQDLPTFQFKSPSDYYYHKQNQIQMSNDSQYYYQSINQQFSTPLDTIIVPGTSSHYNNYASLPPPSSASSESAQSEIENRKVQIVEDLDLDVNEIDQDLKHEIMINAYSELVRRGANRLDAVRVTIEKVLEKETQDMRQQQEDQSKSEESNIKVTVTVLDTNSNMMNQDKSATGAVTVISNSDSDMINANSSSNSQGKQGAGVNNSSGTMSKIIENNSEDVEDLIEEAQDSEENTNNDYSKIQDQNLKSQLTTPQPDIVTIRNADFVMGANFNINDCNGSVTESMNVSDSFTQSVSQLEQYQSVNELQQGQAVSTVIKKKQPLILRKQPSTRSIKEFDGSLKLMPSLKRSSTQTSMSNNLSTDTSATKPGSGSKVNGKQLNSTPPQRQPGTIMINGKISKIKSRLLEPHSSSKKSKSNSNIDSNVTSKSNSKQLNSKNGTSGTRSPASPRSRSPASPRSRSLKPQQAVPTSRSVSPKVKSKSPKSSVKNSPKSSVKNSPKSSVKNSPKSSVKNSPKSSVRNSPKSSVRNSPKQTQASAATKTKGISNLEQDILAKLTKTQDSNDDNNESESKLDIIDPSTQMAISLTRQTAVKQVRDLVEAFDTITGQDYSHDSLSLINTQLKGLIRTVEVEKRLIKQASPQDNAIIAQTPSAASAMVKSIIRMLEDMKTEFTKDPESKDDLNHKDNHLQDIKAMCKNLETLLASNSKNGTKLKSNRRNSKNSKGSLLRTSDSEAIYHIVNAHVEEARIQTMKEIEIGKDKVKDRNNDNVIDHELLPESDDVEQKIETMSALESIKNISSSESIGANINNENDIMAAVVKDNIDEETADITQQNTTVDVPNITINSDETAEVQQGEAEIIADNDSENKDQHLTLPIEDDSDHESPAKQYSRATPKIDASPSHNQNQIIINNVNVNTASVNVLEGFDFKDNGNTDTSSSDGPKTTVVNAESGSSARWNVQIGT